MKKRFRLMLLAGAALALSIAAVASAGQAKQTLTVTHVRAGAPNGAAGYTSPPELAVQQASYKLGAPSNPGFVFASSDTNDYRHAVGYSGLDGHGWRDRDLRERWLHESLAPVVLDHRQPVSAGGGHELRDDQLDATDGERGWQHADEPRRLPSLLWDERVQSHARRQHHESGTCELRREQPVRGNVVFLGDVDQLEGHRESAFRGGGRRGSVAGARPAQ